MTQRLLAQLLEQYGARRRHDQPGVNRPAARTSGGPGARRVRGVRHRSKLEDIHDLFVPNFFFGCEADDPLTATAFNTKLNPFGARLQAMFGSDVSHWDVPDMNEVLEEAWEMVEHEWITDDDFRDFMFTHPVAYFTRTNPAFFDGTAVEAGEAPAGQACLISFCRGGEIVDGTGAPRRRADVGIADGRIVARSRRDSSTRRPRTVDVDGPVVAPGFVDIHTHYDAQLLWDPTASPSPLHGVTTVIGGNCGFTIAPLGARRRRLRDAHDGARRGHAPRGAAGRACVGLGQLRRVARPARRHARRQRRLPRRPLHDAAAWPWATTPSTARPTADAARAHGGAGCTRRMAAGALGLSSSWARPTSTATAGRCRHALRRPDEMLALARAVGDHEGTSSSSSRAWARSPTSGSTLMTAMSLAADRPLNWNLLGTCRRRRSTTSS